MADTFVYPPRNLPGKAEDWGRAVESRDKILEKDLTQAVQKFDNGLRAQGGQLSVVASQIDTVAAQQQVLALQQTAISSTVNELSSRSTHQVSPANISVSGNATVAPFPTASRSFTFPAPAGGRRTAILIFSCEYTSNSSTISANIFPEILQGGSTTWRGASVPVPAATSAPANWVPTTSSFASVQIPAGVSPEFTFRIHRVGFQSTSTTITASNMQAVLIYGDIY